MKIFHEETKLLPGAKNKKVLKKYYLDSNDVIIEQFEVVGESEKLVSTMKIPKKNAPEHIKSKLHNAF